MNDKTRTQSSAFQSTRIEAAKENEPGPSCEPRPQSPMSLRAKEKALPTWSIYRKASHKRAGSAGMHEQYQRPQIACHVCGNFGSLAKSANCCRFCMDSLPRD